MILADSADWKRIDMELTARGCRRERSTWESDLLVFEIEGQVGVDGQLFGDHDTPSEVRVRQKREFAVISPFILSRICTALKTDPTSRLAVWQNGNPASCIQLFQATVIDRYLIVNIYFRSSNVMDEFPIDCDWGCGMAETIAASLLLKRWKVNMICANPHIYRD